MQPKPYEFARPEHFRSFFRDQLPLILLPRYTWENTEELCAYVQMANYGKKTLCGQLEYELREQPKDGRGYSFAGCGESTGVVTQGVLGQVTCPTAALTDVAKVEITLDSLQISKPMRIDLCRSRK